MKIFWLILIAASLIWYILATLIVAFKGYENIRTLLKSKE